MNSKPILMRTTMIILATVLGIFSFKIVSGGRVEQLQPSHLKDHWFLFDATLSGYGRFVKADNSWLLEIGSYKAGIPGTGNEGYATSRKLRIVEHGFDARTCFNENLYFEVRVRKVLFETVVTSVIASLPVTSEEEGKSVRLCNDPTP